MRNALSGGGVVLLLVAATGIGACSSGGRDGGGGGSGGGAATTPPAAAPGSGVATSGLSLPAARARHTATPLPGGEVLLAGGVDASGGVLASTVIVSDSGARPGPDMSSPRIGHRAIALSGGDVLIVGGSTDTAGANVLGTTELFDAASGTLVAGPALLAPRSDHVAARIDTAAGERVLLAAGWNRDASGQHRFLDTIELIDPAGGATALGARLAQDRVGGHAVALPNGEVLLAGGEGAVGPAPAELLDASGALQTVGGVVVRGGVAVAARGGEVLLVGGEAAAGGIESSTEVYEAGRRAFYLGASLAAARRDATATLVGDRIAVVGGWNAQGTIAGTEVVEGPSLGQATVQPGPALRAARWAHTATALPAGTVLVAGGFDAAGNALASIELVRLPAAVAPPPAPAPAPAPTPAPAPPSTAAAPAPAPAPAPPAGGGTAPGGATSPPPAAPLPATAGGGASAPTGPAIARLDDVQLYVNLGDSLAGGHSAPGGEGYHDLLFAGHASRPAYAGHDIAARWPGARRVQNAKSGAQSGEVVSRALSAMNGWPRTTAGGDVIVTVSMGGNDFNDDVATMVLAPITQAKAARLAANYERLIDALRARYEDPAAGRRVVVIGFTIYDPTDGTGQIPRQFTSGFCATAQRFSLAGGIAVSNLGIMNDAIRDVLARKQGFVADNGAWFMGHGMGAQDRWFAGDCAHANREGHHQIRRNVWQVITGQSF